MKENECQTCEGSGKVSDSTGLYPLKCPDCKEEPKRENKSETTD